ncbi:MAG TPA: hypothetical protein VIC08_02565, partial [Cellvibrionaceae bacterium]
MKWSLFKAPLQQHNSWAPIIGALIITMVLAGLYLYHKQQFTLATGVLQQLSRAGDDLSRGYLHLTLSDSPDSPWQRGQGLALLDQALDNYEKIITTLGGLNRYISQDTAASPKVYDSQSTEAVLTRFRKDIV